MALDVTLEDHSDEPGTKQKAAIKVVVIEPFEVTERNDLTLKILRSIDEAQLGFEQKSVSIVFQNNKRKETGRYDLEQEEIQALIQGKMEVKDLTLKAPEVTEEATEGTGMEGMGMDASGMGAGMGMGMGMDGGMGMGGPPPMGDGD
ncbi:MAG: hypothetical protein IPI28_05660 [Candidatus Omnitrophica bacterium]|nr:hypothetical protein [Candidatus Omnitrophota bacterium]